MRCGIHEPGEVLDEDYLEHMVEIFLRGIADGDHRELPST